MAITTRDHNLNTVMTPGERDRLRVGFHKVKELMAVKRHVQINTEWAQIIAHSWELLRNADEPPQQLYGLSALGTKVGVRRKPLTVVRNPDGATIVVDKDRACLRAFFAASFSFLSKERINVPEHAQRALGDAWDIVREPEDPALPFKHRAAADLILPFGQGLKPMVKASRGFH
jgi:hypothetical protein